MRNIAYSTITLLVIVFLSGCSIKAKPVSKKGDYLTWYPCHADKFSERDFILLGVIQNTKSNQELLINQLKKDLNTTFKSQSDLNCITRYPTDNEIKKFTRDCTKLSKLYPMPGVYIENCYRYTVPYFANSIIKDCKGQSVSNLKFKELEDYLLAGRINYIVKNSGRNKLILFLKEDEEKLLVFITVNKGQNDPIFVKFISTINNSVKKAGLSYIDISSIEISRMMLFDLLSKNSKTNSF
ncbi:MAG: hypothetical protein COA39_011435 [Sulfurimonas sp.]|nr:hypothetical protein [Sulfurimonas sp.]